MKGIRSPAGEWKAELCFGQYIRFERYDGAYMGSIDPSSVRGRRKLEKLRKWCDKLLREQKPFKGKSK